MSRPVKSTVPPLYQQLIRALRHEIAEGRYALGSCLPPMRQIAERHHCSLSTVQQAYRELMAEGLLAGDATRGVRVRAFPVTSEPSGRIVCLFPKWDLRDRIAEKLRDGLRAQDYSPAPPKKTNMARLLPLKQRPIAINCSIFPACITLHVFMVHAHLPSC